MLSKPVIVYAGGFPLPDHRASALRAIANARLFASLGVEPLVLGRFAGGHDGVRAAPAGGEETMSVEGIACRNIEAPGGGGARAYLRSALPVRAVVDEVGAERVLAILAYNYPARGLADLLRLSRRRGIPLVAECTEWAAPETRNIVREVTRQIGARYRIKVLARRAGHTICATYHGARHFAGNNVLVLPWVLHETAAMPSPSRDVVRFVYAGSPGQRFGKERIDNVIAALAALGAHPRPFVLELTLTREAVLAAAPHLAPALARLGERVRFHGWLGREPLEALYARADISVFARPDGRASRFGFPTKLAEAFGHGLPVVANNTGDIGAYLEEGETGWLARDASVDALAEALRRALDTPAQRVDAMKRAIVADNPFAPERYRAATSHFLSRIEADRARGRMAA